MPTQRFTALNQAHADAFLAFCNSTPQQIWLDDAISDAIRIVADADNIYVAVDGFHGQAAQDVLLAWSAFRSAWMAAINEAQGAASNAIRNLR